MPQPSRRFPSLLAVFAKLKTLKFLNVHRLFTFCATPLLRLLGSTQIRQHEDITAQDFIVIISLHYRRWRGHRDGRIMQLETVKNDTKVLLDYLGYRHNSKDGRRWYFLMDYDLDYEDEYKVTKPLPRTGLPTRDNILRIIREAAWNGASGLIHFSGHCNFEAPGTSELEYKPDSIIYKETGDSRQGPKVAYLVPCDGKRLYGEDFHLSLQNTSKKSGTSIITVVLDTCKAEAFIRDFCQLPSVYGHESVQLYANAPIPSQSTLGQLVMVTAARADEEAWTVNDCGVLTFFLLKCLRKHPKASAVQVVKYLNAECERQPDQGKRQRPRIWSRYPLNGPFALLPRSTQGFINHSLPSVWHSWFETCLASATQYALLLQEFRPIALSLMPV